MDYKSIKSKFDQLYKELEAARNAAGQSENGRNLATVCTEVKKARALFITEVNPS